MGEKYDMNVETVSKSREEYQSKAYQASGLPPAPAVMVDNEVAAQGPEISEQGIEAVIRKHLGLAPLATDGL